MQIYMHTTQVHIIYTTHTHTHTHAHTGNTAVCIHTKTTIPHDDTRLFTYTDFENSCRHAYIHACTHTYIHNSKKEHTSTSMNTYTHTYIHSFKKGGTRFEIHE